MREELKIGLIQPVINPNLCWNAGTSFKKLNGHKPYYLNIDKLAAERVWQEIKEGLKLLLKREI